jgi:hypothetical protein
MKNKSLISPRLLDVLQRGTADLWQGLNLPQPAVVATGRIINAYFITLG